MCMCELCFIFTSVVGERLLELPKSLGRSCFFTSWTQTSTEAGLSRETIEGLKMTGQFEWMLSIVATLIVTLFYYVVHSLWISQNTF